MAVHCRLATLGDAGALADLFHADWLYYHGEAPPIGDTRAHVRGDVLGTGGMDVALALDGPDGPAVGFAAFAVVYPAPKLSEQMYMKDLFVAEAARGTGAAGR